MRILVTGGTGFIGNHVVRRLIGEGHTVRVLVRNASTAQSLKALGAEIIEGNLLQPASLQGAAAHVDTVVHTAAVVGSGRASVAEYYQANVAGTQTILAEAQRAGVGRFVHISTVGVYGLGALRRGVTEDQPVKPVGSAYVKTKAQAEALVLASGIPSVILRPFWITGGGDRFLIPQVATLLRANRFTLIGNGQQLWSISAVENVGDAAALAAVHPNAPGHIYHVNDAAVPVADIMNEIAKALNLPPIAARTPFALAVLKNMLIYRTAPRYTVDLLFGLWKDATFSTDRICRDLGWQPRIPWRDSLWQGTLEWQRAQGQKR